MNRNQLFAVAATMSAFAGCVAPDDADREKDQTSSVESAITTAHTLYNEYWNQYLYSSGGVGSPMYITSFVNNANYWYMVPITGTGRASYLLKSYYTGLCGGIMSSAQGAPVLPAVCNSGDFRQRWDEVLVSVDGVPYVELKNELSTLCLDTIGGSGSQIGTFSCADPFTQLFTAQTWKVN